MARPEAGLLEGDVDRAERPEGEEDREWLPGAEGFWGMDVSKP
jgi:hypothetical protein